MSVVSHGHGSLVLAMLESFRQSAWWAPFDARILVTTNLAEPWLQSELERSSWPFPIELHANALPQGFGANHNAAFRRADSDWFVVVNPDITWPPLAPTDEIFEQMAATDVRCGLLIPGQVAPDGALQDHMRALVTPWGVLKRAIQRTWQPVVRSGAAQSAEDADWVNGACMVLRSDAFRELGGFDEGYFMYCEDTDFCLRLRLAGWQMASMPLTVVHDARRHTRSNRRHLFWHVRSLWRLWLSSAFWRYGWRKVARGWQRGNRKEG